MKYPLIENGLESGWEEAYLYSFDPTIPLLKLYPTDTTASMQRCT